jgi:aerobic carbon-monoxide dehydrogenase small subunit
MRRRPEARGASSSMMSSRIPEQNIYAFAAQHCRAPCAWLGWLSFEKATPREVRMSVKVSMKVNGKPASAEVEARTLLVTFIREQLRLTGTHVGCDTAQCGACTVHMNGRAIKSCSIVAMQAEGADILTIEGVAKADGTLHPMQQAFKDNHGLQCGFCTPGMVMNALDFAKNNPNPSEQEVRESLEGNLCRCTGYHNIVKSIVAGARAMGGKI